MREATTVSTYAYDHKTDNTKELYELFCSAHINMIIIPYVTMLGRRDFLQWKNVMIA